MKAKINSIGEVEVTKDDYRALQRISKLGIFTLVSDELGYFRQVNLMRISEKFENKCKKYNKDPRQVAPRFLIRFIESSSYEDDESIQDIWADILLAEATPEANSNSLRTIDILKNLSKDEALMFRSVCEDVLYVGSNMVIFNDEGETKLLDVIFRLVDCGLVVSGNVSTENTIKVPAGASFVAYISANKKMVIVVKNETQVEQSCKISIFPLTEAGKDILRASFCKEIDEKKFIKNAKIIKEKNKNLKVSLHKVISIDKGNITYSTRDFYEK